MASGKREVRRMHSAQLKATVLTRCAEPGASVAAIALEHGLNANLVHRWRRIAEGREGGRQIVPVAEQFVPVPIAASTPTPTNAGQDCIRIELRRSGVVVAIDWPVSAAVQCAAWMREIVR